MPYCKDKWFLALFIRFVTTRYQQNTCHQSYHVRKSELHC